MPEEGGDLLVDCQRACVKTSGAIEPKGDRSPGNVERSVLPPIVPSKPRHEDARSCVKKEKSLGTREVTM